jgi:hypothetical protein
MKILLHRAFIKRDCRDDQKWSHCQKGKKAKCRTHVESCEAASDLVNGFGCKLRRGEQSQNGRQGYRHTFEGSMFLKGKDALFILEV